MYTQTIRPRPFNPYRASHTRLLRGSPRCKVACTHQIVTERAQTLSLGSLKPLLNGIRAHESSLTAGRVLEDEKDGAKIVLTASMDKTIAAWRFLPSQEGPDEPPYIEVQKIVAPGGPIFSIVPAPARPSQTPAKPAPPADGSKAPLSPLVFCGNAAKEVVSWNPFTPEFTGLKLGGHTGWVRSVCTYDKYLFSCGCNFLHQWDCTYATPKHLNSVKLFTGDIIAIAAGKGRVYTGGVDGSIRSWDIDKNTGALTEASVREKAHDGRIRRLVLHNGFVYSCSSDGSIKMWSRDLASLVAQAPRAHDGHKVQCLAVAGNGVLYSGGDDQLIRAWLPMTLEPAPGFEPLLAHESSVRMLAAGKGDCLVSGDADGFISVYKVPACPPSLLGPNFAPQASGNGASGGPAKVQYPVDLRCITAEEQLAELEGLCVTSSSTTEQLLQGPCLDIASAAVLGGAAVVTPQPTNGEAQSQVAGAAAELSAAAAMAEAAVPPEAPAAAAAGAASEDTPVVGRDECVGPTAPPAAPEEAAATGSAPVHSPSPIAAMSIDADVSVSVPKLADVASLTSATPSAAPPAVDVPAPAAVLTVADVASHAAALTTHPVASSTTALEAARVALESAMEAQAAPQPEAPATGLTDSIPGDC